MAKNESRSLGGKSGRGPGHPDGNTERRPSDTEQQLTREQLRTQPGELRTTRTNVPEKQ